VVPFAPSTPLLAYSSSIWLVGRLELSDHIVSQDMALVRPIEALATIERLDAEIDALVYELYGLTEEEIALVEGHPQR